MKTFQCKFIEIFGKVIRAGKKYNRKIINVTDEPSRLFGKCLSRLKLRIVLSKQAVLLQACPNATHRRPAFPIEIPILLYRVAKGEWKIKKIVDETTAPRRIYDPIKYRPRAVRAPYPGPMGH